MTAALTLRNLQAPDWPAVRSILQATFAAGQSYPYPADMAEADLHRMWVETPQETYAACWDGQVVGSGYLRPNQAGRGDHVANCGYVVDAEHAGRGVATALCLHSQDRARALGYRAMQFNYVVSTNTRAVALWHHLGFQTVGRVPGAFRHPQLGPVDTLILHKWL